MTKLHEKYPEAFQRLHDVGNEKLNRDHENLLEIILGIKDHLSDHPHKTLSERDQAFIGKSIDRLATRTEVHFESEEAYMASQNFSGLAAHKEEHALFMTRLLVIREQIRKNREIDADGVEQLLETWLFSHIDQSDRIYASHFSDKAAA
ncbi:MAG: hypothetical protein HQL52_04990 [Magnetococcales bacterium]|nr:hypothetical protein [Magnetococcales bacterium]